MSSSVTQQISLPEDELEAMTWIHQVLHFAKDILKNTIVGEGEQADVASLILIASYLQQFKDLLSPFL